MHGTTAATNAVLEGRGARVGVIVNEGFRHLFHLAEAWTPGPLFGFMVYDRPAPLVAVDLMAEVPGRLDAGGEEAEPLDEDERRGGAATELVAAGVEAITVCLLNSYANPVHEQAVARVAEGIVRRRPGLRCPATSSPSSASTSAPSRPSMNAYVAPGDGALPVRPAARAATRCARAPSCRSCAPTAGS